MLSVAITTYLVAALGLAGTLAAALLSPTVHARVTRRDRQSAGLQAALTAYLAATYKLASEIGEMPATPPRPRSFVRRLLRGRTNPSAAWLYGRLAERMIVGSRMREIQDEFATASAQLAMATDSEAVIDAVSDVNKFMSEWAATRTPEMKARWQDVHRDMHELFRAALS